MRIHAQPLSRTKVLVNKLPAESDIYGVFEKSGNKDFGLLRLSSLPFGFKGFETLKLGGFAEYQFGSFKPRADYGPSISFQGNPGNNSDSSFGKIDFRYALNSATIDTYGFLATKTLYSDLLGTYNTKNHNLMLRSGIDFKLDEHNRIGLEAKLQGSGDLHLDYVGIRYTLVLPINP